MQISDKSKIKSIIFENSAKDLFRIELDKNGDVKDIFAIEIKEYEKEPVPSATTNPYQEELTITRKLINSFKKNVAPAIEQKRKEYEVWKEEHEFLEKYNTNMLQKYISNSDDFHDKYILDGRDKVIAWLKDNGYFEQIRNMDESKDDYLTYTQNMLHRAFYAVVKNGDTSFYKPFTKEDNESKTEDKSC